MAWWGSSCLRMMRNIEFLFRSYGYLRNSWVVDWAAAATTTTARALACETKKKNISSKRWTICKSPLPTTPLSHATKFHSSRHVYFSFSHSISSTIPLLSAPSLFLSLSVCLQIALHFYGRTYSVVSMKVNMPWEKCMCGVNMRLANNSQARE